VLISSGNADPIVALSNSARLRKLDWPLLADCVEKLGVEADRDR
jgi:hypothetical protein